MINIYNDKIRIVRGDTASLQINFSQEVDSAVLSIKKSVNDDEYVLQKQIVDGLLQFTHSDTNNLPAGRYVYDIQVTYGDVVDTPLIGVFEILPDVTRE